MWEIRRKVQKMLAQLVHFQLLKIQNPKQMELDKVLDRISLKVLMMGRSLLLVVGCLVFKMLRIRVGICLGPRVNQQQLKVLVEVVYLEET